MKKGSYASKISDILNNMSANEMEIGVELSTEHRYLSNKAFNVLLHLAGCLARDYEKGHYDARNEFACKCSKVIIDALEKEDLYVKKYYNQQYDEIKPKCYD